MHALAKAGAHLVLCLPNKRPIWPRWNRRKPSADVAITHLETEGPLGVIPWSLRSSALDIDFGDPDALLKAFAPWADIPSRKGSHAYFDDDRPRSNSKWAALGCSGEVRSAKGYLVLHGDGLERLADALGRRVPGARPFPRDLFDVGLGDGDPLVVIDVPVSAPRSPPVLVLNLDLENVVLNLDLENVLPGRRNIALFDQVRVWAYRQPKNCTLREWARRVRDYAIAHNKRFPIGLPLAEVLGLAWSVASWVWSGGGPLDHSFAAQSRRGTAG